MIINEQALIKAMKEARKRNGFHAALLEEREELVIQTEWFTVTMDWGNIPGKLLDYAAEATGKMMRPGEAYLVKNKDVQLEMMQIVEETLERIKKVFEDGSGKRIALTALKLGGNELWQCPEDQSIHLMDCDLTGILGSSEAETVLEKHMLRAEGEISSLTVWETEPGEGSRELIEHLQRVLMVR